MCFVALERLDEKSLEKRLRKHGLKLAAQISTEERPNNNKRNRQTNPKPSEPKRSKRGKRNLEDFNLERNCRRKKRKVRPLSYSDSESSGEINPSLDSFYREPQLSSESKDSEVSLNKSYETADLKPELEVESANISTEAKDIQEDITAMVSPDIKVRKEDVERQRKSEPQLKNEIVPQKNDLCHQVSNIDSEIEVIKVCPKPSTRKGWKMPLNDKKGQLTDESVERRQFAEDEFDSREDDEDDRHTVIFQDTDSEEVLEFEGKEVVCKKFNNGEMTNRKKQRLVRFKRKSMAGKNLAKVERKSKNKPAEELNSEREAAEKSTECLSEESLREVCGLIKRLHELSRIILLLQKELPKFGELGADFNSLISAQQENFHREIRKSQKTIIRCYEKMLSFFSDTSQVALEIGKRTSLNVEDVVNIISLCILVEGQCDAEKSVNTGKQGIFPTTAPVNSLRKAITEKLLRILRKKINQKEGVIGVPKQQMPTSTHHVSYPPSQINIPLGAANCTSEVVYRPFNTSVAHPVLEEIHHSSGRLGKVSGASCNNPKIPANCPSRPTRTLQNCVLTPHPKDSELRRLLQTRWNQKYPLSLGTAPRQPAPPKPSDQSVRSAHSVRFHQANGCYYINHANGAAPLFPVSHAADNIAVPVLATLPGCNTPQTLVLDSIKNTGTPNRSAGILRNRIFPSVKLFHCNGGVNPPVQLTNSSEIACPLNTNSRISIRILDNNGSFVTPLELPGKNSNPTSEVLSSAGQVRQEHLDPTVPQKLTMRNCRLQAGPVLGLEVEGTKIMNKSLSQTVEEKTACNKVVNMGRENSKSRVYICAQNDCKNPGVRICNGCQSIIYCSEACQSKHWIMKHKAECYQLKALRE